MHSRLVRTFAVFSILLIGAIHGVASTADVVKTANGPIQVQADNLPACASSKAFLSQHLQYQIFAGRNHSQ